MKKILGLFLMVFLLFGTFSLVVADDSEDDVPVARKVGFFENQMWKLNYAFTFNKEAKIEKALEMAERRLAEAELLADEDPEAYEAAQERYDALVERAEEILSEIESNAEDANSSVDDLERVARIQNRFENHRSHVDEIYTRALERFVANNASDEKVERFEMFYERALNRTDDLEEKILARQENALNRHKALTEMSDEELEDLLDRIEEDEGLTQARETRLERAKERVARIEDKGLEKIDRARLRLLEDAANLTEEERARIQERLENAEGRLDDFGERANERIENQKEVAERRAEALKEAVQNELERRNGNSEDESDNETESEDETELENETD